MNKIIENAKQDNYPHLQEESVFALSLIASRSLVGVQTIFDKGTTSLFISLLNSTNPLIVEKAAIAIGKISSYSIFYRDSIIREGGIAPLVKILSNAGQHEKYLNIIAWVTSNLCRGTPLPKY